MQTFIWISGGAISGSEYLCLVNTAGNDHCFIHYPTWSFQLFTVFIGVKWLALLKIYYIFNSVHLCVGIYVQMWGKVQVNSSRGHQIPRSWSNKKSGASRCWELNSGSLLTLNPWASPQIRQGFLLCLCFLFFLTELRIKPLAFHMLGKGFITC